MRPRISIRGSVRPSVRLSVRPSRFRQNSKKIAETLRNDWSTMKHSKSDANNNHTSLRSHRWPTGLVYENVTDQRNRRTDIVTYRLRMHATMIHRPCNTQKTTLIIIIHAGGRIVGQLASFEASSHLYKRVCPSVRRSIGPLEKL